MGDVIEGLLGLLVAVLVGVFIGGRYVKDKQATKQQERNAKAHERAKEVRDEVGSLSGSDVTDRLRKRSGK